MKAEIIHTEEELLMAQKIVDEGVVENPLGIFYLTLGQSGNSKDVRFVLYRLNLKANSPHVNPFQFQCVLSDNLVEAAHKAKNYCGNTPIVIDFNRQNAIKEYQRWTPDVVRFGKNYGLKISECEPNFIIWVAKGCPLYDNKYECWGNHYFGGEAFMPIAQQVAIDMKLGVMYKEMFMANEQYAKFVAKEQLLDSLIHGHHEKNGERITKEMTIVRVGGYESIYGYINILTMHDEEKKMYTYKGGSFPITAANGDKIKLTATIKHDIYKEKATTYIQRVKIIAE